jgi:glycine dehydrogenase
MQDSPTQAAATPPRASLAELEQRDAFARRHIGPDAGEQAAMLSELGYPTRAALIDAVVPAGIRKQEALEIGDACSEAGALAELRTIAARNRVLRSFIGQGYYDTELPGVILRNLVESPAWYTAYTPYQPEISQGRLEALINFQTMVCDLSGMAIANASMLDEGTAAAEAMALCRRSSKNQSLIFYVADSVLPQTMDVVRTVSSKAALSIHAIINTSPVAAS